MKLRLLAQATVPALAIIAASQVGRERLPPTSPTPSRLSFGNLLVSEAKALPKCNLGVRSKQVIWVHDSVMNYPNICTSARKVKFELVENCDGTPALTRITTETVTPCRVSTPCDNSGHLWFNDNAGECWSWEPVDTNVCIENCPEPDPPCSDEGDSCSNVGEPISVAAGALYYQVDIVPLYGDGFPPTLVAQYAGQGGFASTSQPGGSPLGHRWRLNLIPALTRIEGDQSNPATTNALSEDGAVIPFELEGNGWVAKSGRVAALTIDSVSGCNGTATLTLGNGNRYTFHEPCGGAERKEGRVQRIDRPNGDYLIFTADAAGDITRIENRRGVAITLAYLAGKLQSVTLPTGEVIEFNYFVNAGNGNEVGWEGIPSFLASIKKQGDAANLWTMDYTLDGVTQKGLIEVRDARGKREHRWEYTDGNATRVSREYGPWDEVAGNDNYIDIDNYVGSTDVSFPDSSGTTRTNTYRHSTLVTDRPRVNDRTMGGTCPNCGEAELFRSFWPNTTYPRVVRDADGTATVYADLTPGLENDQNAAYDVLGNPKVVYTGCTLLSWQEPTCRQNPAPSCFNVTEPDCEDGEKRTFTYAAGTRVLEQTVEPGTTAGTTVVTTMTFDPGTTRVASQSTLGLTAGAQAPPDGVVNDSRTKKIDYVYDPSGQHELTSIRGPYWGEDGFDDSDPRTDFDYFGDGQEVCFTGSAPPPNPFNVGKVKAVSQWVDPVRKLTTTFGNYDAAGRPRRICNSWGMVTSLAYNWRGQITEQIVDEGGQNFRTNLYYDENGNLTEIRFPRGYGGDRNAVIYTYDAADRLVRVRNVYVTPTGAYGLYESIVYAYDRWGNRTKTEYRNASDVVETSESAKYDEFNRLVCIARPADANCEVALSKTTFGYFGQTRDLVRVTDAQGDDTEYGSGVLGSFAAQYARLGLVTQARTEKCDHLSDPNESCANSPSNEALWAETLFEYDKAQNVKRVTIEDDARGGQIVTEYVHDDFGNVVKILSPDSGVQLFRYDAAGRLVESLDQLGNEYTYQYDRAGRLLAKINSTGTGWVTEVRYCYDNQDALCGFINTSGFEGLLTAVDDKAGKADYNIDALGRYTAQRRILNSGATFTTYFTWDPNGNLTKIQPPGSSVVRTVHTFGYAWKDQESSVGYCLPTDTQCNTPVPLISNITWTASGELESWRMGSTSGYYHRFLRDGAGRITASELWQSPGVNLKAQDTYAYANDGNVKTRNGTAIAHDSLSRLRSDESASYGFDDAGNRTSSSLYGTPAITYQASSDKVQTAYGANWTTDANGNVTNHAGKTIGYAADGSLTSVNVSGYGTTTYERDFQNLRLTKAGAGGLGTFVFDFDGQLIHWNGPTESVLCTLGGWPPQLSTYQRIWLEEYVYVGGVPLAMIRSFVRTGCGNSTWQTATISDVFYYYVERMGVPRGVYRKSDGRIVWAAYYDAWGRAYWINEDFDGDGQILDHKLRLPGQYALSVAEGGPSGTAGGFHENWWRMYDSTTGRYLQPDPLGILPHGALPAAIYGFAGARNDLYGYAAQSPLAWVDPDARGPRMAVRGAMLGFLGGSAVGGALGGGGGAAGGSALAPGPGTGLGGVLGGTSGVIVGGTLGLLGGAAIGACQDDAKTECIDKALGIFAACMVVEADTGLCLDKMWAAYVKCMNSKGLTP